MENNTATETIQTKSVFKRNETPYISIQKGNSTGFLSSRLARFLSLTDGDYIQFHRHKDHKFCWSLSITQEPLNAARLSVPKSTTMWRFNDINYISQLCEIFMIGESRVRLYIDIRNFITKKDLSGNLVKQYQIIDIPMQRYDLPAELMELYVEQYTKSITSLT